MYAQMEKPKYNKNKAVSNSVVRKKNNVKKGFGFVDNRQIYTPKTRIENKPEENKLQPRQGDSIVQSYGFGANIKTSIGGGLPVQLMKRDPVPGDTVYVKQRPDKLFIVTAVNAKGMSVNRVEGGFAIPPIPKEQWKEWEVKDSLSPDEAPAEQSDVVSVTGCMHCGWVKESGAVFHNTDNYVVKVGIIPKTLAVLKRSHLKNDVEEAITLLHNTVELAGHVIRRKVILRHIVPDDQSTVVKTTDVAMNLSRPGAMNRRKMDWKPEQQGYEHLHAWMKLDDKTTSINDMVRLGANPQTGVAGTERPCFESLGLAPFQGDYFKALDYTQAISESGVIIGTVKQLWKEAHGSEFKEGESPVYLRVTLNEDGGPRELIISVGTPTITVAASTEAAHE